MALSKDQVFSIRASLPTEDIDVPELGGSIRIRLLTLKEVEQIKRVQKTASDPIGIYSPIVAMSCVNDDGTQMFVGEDAKMIDTLPWSILQRIVEASMKLSRLAPEESPPKA